MGFVNAYWLWLIVELLAGFVGVFVELLVGCITSLGVWFALGAAGVVQLVFFDAAQVFNSLVALLLLPGAGRLRAFFLLLYIDLVVKPLFFHCFAFSVSVSFCWAYGSPCRWPFLSDVIVTATRGVVTWLGFKLS